MQRATRFLTRNACPSLVSLWEILGLLIWFLFCVYLLAFKRYIYPYSPPRFFLVNNLFAGLIPWLLTLLIIGLQGAIKKQKVRRLLMFIFFCSWLLFLPNSLYLFTDIVHLQDLKSYSFYTLETLSFPYWLDLIIFVNFALLSFYLGLLSIFQWHMQLLTWSKLCRSSLLTLIFLCVGIGVYLGRFARLFSWEAAGNLPFIIHEINTLLSYPYALTFSLALTFTYFISYWVIFFPRIELKNTRLEASS